MAGSHRPPRMVECELCGGKFRTTQAFNGHKRFRHRGINNKTVNSLSDLVQIEASKRLDSEANELFKVAKFEVMTKMNRGDNDWEIEG